MEHFDTTASSTSAERPEDLILVRQCSGSPDLDSCRLFTHERPGRTARYDPVRLAELSRMDPVTVAYLDEPPFCAPVPDGEPAGADMDVARRVLTDAGVAAIEYTLTTFSELIPGLLAGRWQMTTALFVTPERSALIAYSRPIWAVPDGF